MVAEETHEDGAKGARRAKRWLEATMRAEARWVRPHRTAAARLTFTWHDGTIFSFDIGGILVGGELDGMEFLAESKFYSDAHDQLAHYYTYLARCYRALELRPERCGQFIWITWAAFGTSKWSKLLTPELVREHVANHSPKVFGEQKSIDDVPMEQCKSVADRLSIIVLSEWQERYLVLTPEHLGVLAKHLKEEEARSVDFS